MWSEHGALDYHECVADDVKPGKWTSFPQSVKLKKDEVVVFPGSSTSRAAHRDRIMKKVMKDQRLAEMMDPKNMPFDGKRMIFGGFKTLGRLSTPAALPSPLEFRVSPRGLTWIVAVPTFADAYLAEIYAEE